MHLEAALDMLARQEEGGGGSGSGHEPGAAAEYHYQLGRYVARGPGGRGVELLRVLRLPR